MVTFAVGAGAGFQKSMFPTTCRYLKESVFLECSKKSNLLPMFAQSSRTRRTLAANETRAN